MGDPLPGLAVTGRPVYAPAGRKAQQLTCPSTGTVVDGGALMIVLQTFAAHVLEDLNDCDLTCPQADRLVALLAYGGHELTAATVLIGHVQQDDDVSDHEGHQVLRMHYEACLSDTPDVGAQSVLDAALEYIRTQL